MQIQRPFSQLDWLSTPEAVRQYIVQLENAILQLQQQLDQLEKRTEKLETQTKKNSQNSSKPPSSDSPYKKIKKKTKSSNRKKGAQKGHKGNRQAMMKPTDTIAVLPAICSCGNTQFDPQTMKPFYTHQYIELPEIKMNVLHFVLQKCPCACCGKTVKARIPNEYRTGYGPRLSAVIAERSGIHGDSRESVQNFCASVLNLPISIGAIQSVIDRSSQAIKPIYESIGAVARQTKVNYIDETSWFQCGKLKWLWTMVNTAVAFFMVHPNRSKDAFMALIDDWKGILVSDNYGVYVKWMIRQSCLAHYIRQAKALTEQKSEELKQFGSAVLKELRLLCHWAKSPPNDNEWAAFYTRFIQLITDHEESNNDAGKLSRALIREMITLWVFLEEHGVEPTNNRAERALRAGVLWRKRSKGTQSDKGDRWVERILSLKQTCRMRFIPTFPILVEAIDSFFKEREPNLNWLG
jgi:transposase